MSDEAEGLVTGELFEAESLDSGVWHLSGASEQADSIPEVIQEDLFASLDDGKNYLVYKRNELIHGRFQLSAFAQKTMAALVARIDPRSDNIPHFEFSVPEFAHILGVSRQMVYKAIDDVTDELQRQVARLAPRDLEYDKAVEAEYNKARAEGRRPIPIPRPPVDAQSFEKINWFHKSKYSHSEGRITFIFHEDMREYLLNFSSNFTQYHYHQIRDMRSSYAIRLYEILRSYLALKYVRKGQMKVFRTIGYKDLREMLGITDGIYKKFYDFERRILKVAQDELLETDLRFDYSLPDRIKPGSKAPIKTIKFHITALSTEFLRGETADWRQQFRNWLPSSSIDALCSNYPSDLIQRNVEMVAQQLGDGKVIRDLKAYLISAIKNDMAGSDGAINPYNYTDETQRAFVQERLRGMWESLPQATRDEFIQHRFRQGIVAEMFHSYKAETKQRSVTEEIMDIHATDW